MPFRSYLGFFLRNKESQSVAKSAGTPIQVLFSEHCVVANATVLASPESRDPRFRPYHREVPLRDCGPAQVAFATIAAACEICFVIPEQLKLVSTIENGS